MSGKVITKEQIDALPIIRHMLETYVPKSSLLNLYDNAPSVDAEPVGQVLKSSGNLGFANQGTVTWFGNPVKAGTKLYTTPQLCRVAELEATIKSYNEFLARGTPEKYRAKIAELEAKLKEYEADAKVGRLVKSKMKSGNCIPVSRCVITSDEIDQEMKG